MQNSDIPTLPGPDFTSNCAEPAAHAEFLFVHDVYGPRFWPIRQHPSRRQIAQHLRAPALKQHQSAHVVQDHRLQNKKKEQENRVSGQIRQPGLLGGRIAWGEDIRKSPVVDQM